MSLDSKGKGKEKAAVDEHDRGDEGRWHPARDTDAWTATSVWRESRRRAQANKDSWDYSQYKSGSCLTIAHCSPKQRCSGRYSRLCGESSSPTLNFDILMSTLSDNLGKNGYRTAGSSQDTLPDVKCGVQAVCW